MSRFYRFYHYLAKVLFFIFTRRVIVRGSQHIPKHGAAILISNHISYSDPATIIGYVKRHVYFMTKAEMFDGGFMDWVITRAGAFPVRRGEADRMAFRRALQLLSQGQCIGLYPEGTRSTTRTLQQARAGVVLLAKQSGAPIIPIAITGMEQVFLGKFPWFGRPTVTITIGEPQTLEQLAQNNLPIAHQRDYLAEQIMAQVAALLPQAYGGTNVSQLSYE